MISTWMPNHLKHFKFVDYKTSTTEDSSTTNVLLNLWESIPYCLSSSSVDEVWDSGCVVHVLGTLELCAEGRCCEIFFSECLVI